MTTTEASRYLAERGIRASADTIRRWAKAGKLNVITLPSGRLLIPADELDRISSRGTVPARAGSTAAAAAPPGGGDRRSGGGGRARAGRGRSPQRVGV